MTNNKNISENDILGAILGAALMASQAEQEEPIVEPDESMERAKALRKQYEAFIEVGFTEHQAERFIASILH